MSDDSTKTPQQQALVETPPKASEKPADSKLPEIIKTRDEYDLAYRLLQGKCHLLSPMSSFSGMAPQHGIIMSKVVLNNDPRAGEVYADGLFCKKGSPDPLDDEVALTKIGLRRLALAGAWSIDTKPVHIEPNYWLIEATLAFVGINGARQTFKATEEYDLRDDSSQLTSAMKPGSSALKMARAHGYRAAESRAGNAACREFGIRQKYTRRDLLKPFVIMQSVFLPDPNNATQMAIITERALGSTSAMFPQASRPALELDGVDGLGDPIDVPASHITDETEPTPALPDGYVLIREVKEEKIKRKPPKTGEFSKWRVVDSHGVEHVTIERDYAEAALACWHKEDWTKGRPVEIISTANAYRENEIDEITALAAEAK